MVLGIKHGLIFFEIVLVQPWPVGQKGDFNGEIYLNV